MADADNNENPALRNWQKQVVATERGDREVTVPRLLNDIVDDVRKGFDGFPRNLGGLFYFDDEGKKIVALPKVDSLAAWIQGAGDCGISFKRGVGFASMGELYHRLLQTAQEYSAAARVPFWPKRDDLFELFGELPDADENATAFWGLLDYMRPATPEDRLLMAAAFLAPLYYTPKASRPAWCIDTVDAQGSGKSTVVKVCTRLYDCEAFDIGLETLKKDESAIKKRIISTEGRQTRIALIDNITGESVSSAALAKFVTAASISDRAAYGHGEAIRPNDITWFMTMNGAKFDTDLASRCYTLKVRKPENPDPFWEEQVYGYIEANRLQIMADMVAMLERVAARKDDVWTRKSSRFARFDSLVLAAVCKDREEFDAVDTYLSSAAEETNEDLQVAQTFAEAFEKSISEKCEGWKTDKRKGIVVSPGNMDAFLQSIPALAKYKSRNVREWVKNGMLPQFDKDFDRVENSRAEGDFRHRKSFLWLGSDPNLTPTLTLLAAQPITIDGTVGRWDTPYETTIRR